ncbi:MAG: hypothetical protein IPK19_22170 [Chloroflexi bacterium]|nr:hypothetical protein [Chloroflexota bacterium]
MVSSSDLQVDDDFVPFTIFYDGSQVIDGLRKGVEIVQSGAYQEMRRGFEECMRESFKEHQARYIG